MLRLKTWEWFLVLLRSVAVLYSLVIVAVWIHLARTEPNPTFTNLIYGVPFTAAFLALLFDGWEIYGLLVASWPRPPAGVLIFHELVNAGVVILACRESSLLDAKPGPFQGVWMFNDTFRMKVIFMCIGFASVRFFMLAFTLADRCWVRHKKRGDLEQGSSSGSDKA